MDLPHHGAASAEAGCFDLLLKSTWKRGWKSKPWKLRVVEVEKIDTFGIHEFFGLARLTNWEVPLNKNQDDINFPLAQLENGENIPPQKWKKNPKKIWTHYRAPICFVEDFRHFSCLGSQDGLGGQFFLWGEPLGSPCVSRR